MPHFPNIFPIQCIYSIGATIWYTEENRKLMESKLQEDLNQIKTWSSQWRMKLSSEKTE
jgi:predicted permease